MSIFPHLLLLVFFSFLLCPVASQPGQGIKEGDRTNWNCVLTSGTYKLTADCNTPTAPVGFFRGGLYVTSKLTIGGIKRINSQTLIVTVDGGSPQTISVGANCDTVSNCITALGGPNGITGATLTAANGNLVITSDTTGPSSSVAIGASSETNAAALFGTPVAVNGNAVSAGTVTGSFTSHDFSIAYPVISGNGYRIFVLGNNGNLQLANVVLSGAMGKEKAGLYCPATGGYCSSYPSCGCSRSAGEGCCCGAPRAGGAITVSGISSTPLPVRFATVTKFDLSLYAVSFLNNNGACTEGSYYGPDIYIQSTQPDISQHFALVMCKQSLSQLKIGGQVSQGLVVTSKPAICTNVVDVACVAAGYSPGCPPGCFGVVPTTTTPIPDPSPIKPTPGPNPKPKPNPNSNITNNCSPGKYLTKTMPEICTNCLPGYYASNTGQTNCTECPSGQFQQRVFVVGINKTGSNTIDDCKSCPLGYSPSASNATACSGCDYGRYQNEMSATTWGCKDCGVGKYSQGFKSACASCEVGMYQPLVAVDQDTEVVCRKCRIGQYPNAAQSECIFDVMFVAIGFVSLGIFCALVALVVGGSIEYSLILIVILAPTIVALILIWYFFKVEEDNEYETFDEFYKTRCPFLQCDREFCLRDQLIFVVKVCVWFFFWGIVGVVLFLIWNHFKIDNDDLHETFIKFYKIRISRLCYEDNRQRRGSTLEMSSPLLANQADQDPLELAQWIIPPDQLTIGKRIGQGGCGWIYQGTYGGSSSSVPIACKEVMSATIDPGDLAEFNHEARMMTQLHHPCLIKFYGICQKTINNEQTCGYDEKRLYMVCELAPGGSLEGVIEEAELLQIDSPEMKLPFDDIQTVKWALQIASGMTHMHGRGFIHRDIKPQNILINGVGDALICDLGTVKNLDPNAPRFDLHLIDEYKLMELQAAAASNPDAPPLMTQNLGTPMYMAPESHRTRFYTKVIICCTFGTRQYGSCTNSC